MSSKDLGFSVENRLIVGENLSQLNHELFVLASNMKRDNKVAQVFTSNGLVNVKIQKGGRTYEIRNKQQLETLAQTTTPENNKAANASSTTNPTGARSNNNTHSDVSQQQTANAASAANAPTTNINNTQIHTTTTTTASSSHTAPTTAANAVNITPTLTQSQPNASIHSNKENDANGTTHQHTSMEA